VAHHASAAVADHKNNPADHAPVIHPRHAMRLWKIRLDPAHLRLRQQNQITHGSASPRCSESDVRFMDKEINGS
jgi:hypothetical protein